MAFLPITAPSSASQSMALEAFGSFTVALLPVTVREALMKCHGFNPTSWGSGAGGMPCSFAISIMWSV